MSEFWKMPDWLSIAIIVGILVVSVGASLWATRGQGGRTGTSGDDPEPRVPGDTEPRVPGTGAAS